MTQDLSQRQLLSNVTREDIWPDGKFPKDLPDDWKPNHPFAVQRIPRDVLELVVKAIGQVSHHARHKTAKEVFAHWPEKRKAERKGSGLF